MFVKWQKKRPTSVNIPLGNIGEHRDQSIMVRFHHGSAHWTNDTDHVHAHRPRSKASRMFLQYFFCNMASLLHAWLHLRQAEITLMTAPAITHTAMDSHWRTRWGSQCPPLSTSFILVKKHESRPSYILSSLVHIHQRSLCHFTKVNLEKHYILIGTSPQKLWSKSYFIFRNGNLRSRKALSAQRAKLGLV